MQRGAVMAVVLAIVPVASLASAQPASAQPARTARLDATGTCALPALEVRASELLGRPAIATDATAQIHVDTASDGDAVTARLTFVDENGDAQPSRTVKAASCDELAESVAIVISLVLREDAPAPRPPAPSPTPPPVPAVEEAREDLLAPAPQPTSAGVLELGAATSSARRAALVVGGRLERARHAFAADLTIAMPEQVDVVYGAVHVTAARVDAGACLRTTRFAGCGLVAAGAVRARGEDLMDARTAIRPLASLALRAEWRQPLSRHVGLRLFASVEQLLVRPRFLVGDTAIWSEPLVQAWLGGGMFFQMP